MTNWDDLRWAEDHFRIINVDCERVEPADPRIYTYWYGSHCDREGLAAARLRVPLMGPDKSSVPSITALNRTDDSRLGRVVYPTEVDPISWTE